MTVKEDLFLYELEEFTNETVDKSYDLLIPGEKSGNWGGLKGDCKYYFSLIVQCPEDETDIVTTTISDVIIETNAPPEIDNFDIKPLEGVAFLTKFTFKTQKARDKEGDGPFSYKFGYFLNNRSMIFSSLTDTTTIDTVLPYCGKQNIV